MPFLVVSAPWRLGVKMPLHFNTFKTEIWPMTTATATQTFTILAADKLAKQGLDWINAQPDAELLNKPGLTEEEYGQMLSQGGIHAMIVRSGIKVTAKVLENPGDLRSSPGLVWA